MLAFSAGDRLLTVPSSGGPERIVAVDPPTGPFAWMPDGAALAYIAKDRICTVPATGGRGRVIAEADAPITDFAVSPQGRIAYVTEQQHVHIDGHRQPRTADFVIDPTWSPDGETLVWHEWDAPKMPWDWSRIVASDGRVIAMGGVQQPRFSPDGQIAYLSDSTGWLNLWVDGWPVLLEEFEHGDPPWFGGQRSFCWSPDSTAIALSRNEGGFGRLLRVDVATGDVELLRRGVHRSLSWQGDCLAAIRTGGVTPTQITVNRTVVAHGPVGGFEPALVEPEPVEWEADDGAVVHGRLHRPPQPLSDPPPMIVQIHGGPTGQNQVIFDAKTSYWVDRGWAVLVPDQRGSTGWGRQWMRALHGRWGEADTADVAAGMRAAAARGWADPKRIVVMGNSSGGMTVLLLLAFHGDLCAAGVATAPVSDLVDLAKNTHRFEQHYNESLLGPSRTTWRERSPIKHAARIDKPLLVFHGADDDVVPKAQTRRLAKALRQNGVDVEHVEYPGEGHGVRRAGHVEDQLGRTEAFLSRVVLLFPE
jgi:dipeptidyl aminopeptidase/acylaminoacyl peptidase